MKRLDLDARVRRTGSPFERHAMILPPLYENPSIEDHTVTWDQAEKAYWLRHDDDFTGAEKRKAPAAGTFRGYDHDLLMSIPDDYLVQQGGEPDEWDARMRTGWTKRVRWRELAEQLGIDYGPGIMNDDIFGPGPSWPLYLGSYGEEGSLDRETCARLAAVIEETRPGRSCLFWYEGWTTNTVDDLLLQGRVEDVTETFEMEEDTTTPALWWREDGEWSVYTDWDEDHSYIAGDSALIDRVLADDFLEAIEVPRPFWWWSLELHERSET